MAAYYDPQHTLRELGMWGGGGRRRVGRGMRVVGRLGEEEGRDLGGRGRREDEDEDSVEDGGEVKGEKRKKSREGEERK